MCNLQVVHVIGSFQVYTMPVRPSQAKGNYQSLSAAGRRHKLPA